MGSVHIAAARAAEADNKQGKARCLKVLILGGGAADVERVRREFHDRGFHCTAKHVAVGDAFVAALDSFAPDVALIDLASLDTARDMLQRAHKARPDIPVIIVAHPLGEEAAIDLLKAGAKDYVLKNDLRRLAPAVQRALADQRDIEARKTTEKQLHDSEERFRTLIESFSDYVWQVDENARYTYVSDGVKATLGYDASELIGKTPFSIMPSTEAERVASVFGPIAAEHRSFSLLQNVVLHKDGRELVLETSGLPIFDDGGVFRGYFGIDHDITARRRAERALAESELMFHTIFDAEADGILVADAQTRRMVLANPAMCQMLGYSKTELLELSVDALLPPAVRPLAAGYFERLDSDRRRTAVEIAMKRKDGAEFTATVIGSPMTLDGRLYSIGLFHDTTERHRQEEQLREEKEKLRGLVEQNVAGIAIFREDGSIAYGNPFFAALSGREIKDVIGRSIFEFVPIAEHAALQEKLAEQFSGPAKLVQLATSAQTIDGRMIDLLVNASRVTFEGRPASIAIVLDITERKRAEEALRASETQLKRLNRALRTLSVGNSTLVRAEREQDFLEAMCRILVEVGGYAAAWIGYAEHDEAKTVRPVAWAGNHADFIMRAQVSWADVEPGRGPVGVAIRTGEPVINCDFASNPSMAPWRREAREHGFAANIALPLKENDAVFGALTIYAQEYGAFDPEEVKLLTEFSADLAFGIGALRTRAAREEGVIRLRKAMTSTVLALAATVERRDPYTAGHQRNVARLASAIAAKIGISPQQRDGIYLAAIIHDIGKVQIPGEILSKPGKLSPLEFDLVKTHAQAGYDIVKGIDFPWPVADIILQHHERLDGSGYPHGLKGDAILTGAKILAVADVVEAMTAFRPYRAGLGVDAALAEIGRGKGVRYDPAAVDACVELIRNEGFTF